MELKLDPVLFLSVLIFGHLSLGKTKTKLKLIFSKEYDYNSKPVDSVLVTVVHLYLINFHHDVYLVATRLERSLKKYLNRCASLFI